MKMEYNTTSAPLYNTTSAPLRAVQPAVSEHQLDRLDRINNRLDTVNDRLEGFTDRFHGRPSGSSSDNTAVPAGYVGQLARAEDSLARLEAFTETICEIG